MPRGRPSSKLAQQDFPYVAISKIVAHTLDPDTALVTLTVLVKGSRLDVSEWDVQEHRPTLLYDYWASFRGKTRQDVLGIGELYHPFRLLRHRRVRGQWQVLVQWLGYTNEGEDVSWEPAVKMRADAPDVLTDYCGYVNDESVDAALLGPMARAEGNGDVEESNETKPLVATPASARHSAKRKRDSLVEQPEIPSEKRRRPSRHDSTPATKGSLPRSSASKRRQPQLPPDVSQSQTTPRPTTSVRKQSRATMDELTNTGASPAPTKPLLRRKSTRGSSVEPATSIEAQRLSPADVPRTMLWFMDDFTVGDMQKVCRFIDEHCTGKLRLPLYSGGDWDGKAASGRWEDVFMVSPLGRLGRYDNQDGKEE
ncbi:hypothetical protein CORC01_04598 [Colletotrichum orchidophilum]|uniref:Chromo domain-containing protein n=1 Tax=Colletotrichum orchidophilum TaxID=1209926 RepID=A0A1G4BFB8_9PEZI|nr:uncharacterized protein CORC01_04598 [Colletotrichum orchidophilum]OHF00190.1 hypothetical protein CORC01_04598 [Colletotrichum orchidophilum]